MLKNAGNLVLMVLALAWPASMQIASAQDEPDMIGTWKGRAQAVFLGSNPYRLSEKNGANFADKEIEFTFVIDEQQGNRFAGHASGGTMTETIIGVVNPAASGGIMLDDDGRYDFTLVDPETIDVCYAHAYPPTKVLACYRIKRSSTG